MGRRISLGIVGFGRIVELVHLPQLKKLPEIAVEGIYDITPQRLELASKRGFRTYEHLEDLLNSSVDGVVIATPPVSHYEIAAKALSKGKHVLIEKPVTGTASEASKLLHLAREHRRVVTVFQNRRFDPAYLWLKQFLAEDKLGSLLFVERRHHMFGSGESFGVRSFHPNWRNELGYGGGALLDWGVHCIDQMLQLRLGAIRDIDASLHRLRWDKGDADDYVRALFRMENGVLMSMEVNFGSNADAPLWVVGGEKGTLRILSDTQAEWLEKGKPPQWIDIHAEAREGQLRIYQAFSDCLLRGGELAVTLEEAVQTMNVIDAIREAANNKREATDGNFIFSSPNGI